LVPAKPKPAQTVIATPVDTKSHTPKTKDPVGKNKKGPTNRVLTGDPIKSGKREDTSVPALWNPTAAMLWSLFFLPLGAFIHSRNAATMELKYEAKANRRWFFILLTLQVILLLLNLVLLIPGEFIHLNSPPIGFYLYLNIALLLSWYFDIGVKQRRHVMQAYGNNYLKRKWGKPLLSLFSWVAFVFIVLYMVRSFNAGSRIVGS